MERTIFQCIQSLLNYGIRENLIHEEDLFYARNRILSILHLDTWQEVNREETPAASLMDILANILDWASRKGLLKANTIVERDIFDTEVMNALMPRPSEVVREFQRQYEKSPERATNYFYHLSTASNYIRGDRIKRNIKWKTPTPYGEMDLTINVSKPEKDPKAIAFLNNAPRTSYPACLLCKENEGYRGNLRNPARATHRVIPLVLNLEGWCMQYSPYVYYNEHAIVFRKEHLPMKITRETFRRLLDFIELFPHYFIGSNADLPIVGGSILSHDHFQGGRYEFAIEKANVDEQFFLKNFPSVSIGILNWSMSVVRVYGEKEEVAVVTERIWNIWQEYEDKEAEVLPYSGSTQHNTVTPIARRRNGLYEMDLVLRNNRTTFEFPDGIFHPHQELHHIKKENIGLIEVMGLAVLPGRLETELKKIAEYLLHPIAKEQWDLEMIKHWEWYEQLSAVYTDLNEMNVMETLRHEVGRKFQNVLEHAGVFKRTEEGKRSFAKFMKHVQIGIKKF